MSSSGTKKWSPRAFLVTLWWAALLAAGGFGATACGVLLYFQEINWQQAVWFLGGLSAASVTTLMYVSIRQIHWLEGELRHARTASGDIAEDIHITANQSVPPTACED